MKSSTLARQPPSRDLARGKACRPGLHAPCPRSSVPPTANGADADLNELLRAAGMGCTASFARLYERTSPRLFAMVLRVNWLRADAEDVLQDTYIKAWTQSATFDAGKGSVMGWLISIARHGAIDSLRRQGTRPHVQRTVSSGDADDPYAQILSSQAGPMELAIRSHLSTALRRCLQSLPPDQRQSLALGFYNGLSHAEISHHLDKPLGTVKCWVRRGLATLRAALPDQH